MPSVGRWLTVVVLLLLAPVLSAQPGSVRAELSSGTIAIDESVTLSITARDADGGIDTSGLEKQFDVVSRSQSQQVSIINGQRSDITTWALELVPRETGVFTVPAVKVGSAQSQLLTLTVDEAPTGAARRVFVETRVDKASPWVQEQVILTLRVFQSVDVLDGSLDEPRGDGLMIVPLDDRRVFTEGRDGVEFRVTEIRFAVFAQQSGAATIEPVTLVASIPNEPARAMSYRTPTRRLTRQSAALGLDVRPKPANAAGQWWLPARDVTLSERWSTDAGRLRVGEPVMRTITLSGNGVLDTQLPRLDVPDVDGLRLYEDAVDLDRDVDDAGVRSRQRTIWSIMPEQAGTVTLPAIRVDWFDTDSGTAQLARLPARTITVLPALAGQADGTGDESVDESGGAVGDEVREAAGQSAEAEKADDGTVDEAAAPTAGTSDSEPRTNAQLPADADTPAATHLGWQHWAIGLPLTLALALSTFVLLWHARHRRASPALYRVPQPDAATRRRVATSCRQGDVEMITAAVMAWAREVWPSDAPRSLAGVSERLPEGGEGSIMQACRHVLAELDAARYSSRALTSLSAPAGIQALPAQLDEAWRLLRKRTVSDARNAHHLPAL